MTNRLHENEIEIGETLVEKLLASQFPDFASLPITSMSTSGSSNLQFRLGNDLLVRLPRQPGGGVGIRKEQRWTEILGSQLPVAVPDIVEVGEPELGYPEHWSITKWQEGSHPKTRSSNQKHAEQLAEIVLAFREIPVSYETRADKSLYKHYRGRALAEFDPHMPRQIELCRGLEGLELDLDKAELIWQQAMTLPGADQQNGEHWLHTDIVAENLMVENGNLTCLLDFGGLGVGDPTVDLHGAWELFDAPTREYFRKLVNVDDATWLRARAWALAIAMMTFPYYWQTLPGRVADRLVMAQEVLAGDLDG